MVDLKTVSKQHCDEKQDNESEGTRRDWVKPSVKRLALKDALSGNDNTNCDGTAAQCMNGNSFRS